MVADYKRFFHEVTPIQNDGTPRFFGPLASPRASHSPLLLQSKGSNHVKRRHSQHKVAHGEVCTFQHFSFRVVLLEDVFDLLQPVRRKQQHGGVSMPGRKNTQIATIC